MSISRQATLLIQASLALALLCHCPASFAASPQADRIVGPIAGTPVVWLEGNRRARFLPENDHGPVADSLRIENITLMFKLTDGQQADLTALLDEQQDPSSPNYHRWLSPEQYADRFGLSPNDVAHIAAWLEAQGFEVTETARGRNWICFSGTAAQVRAAFQTEIHTYLLAGQQYYANAFEPAVPAALAGVVLGLHGLDNYPLRPSGVFRQVRAEPQPYFTSSLSGNDFLAPADFAIIYDVASLYAAGIDGTGQSIAVMGQTDLYNNGSDITAFRSASGLPAKAPQVILISGAPDPGVVSTDIFEASLDVEWAGAVAKNANIIYVNGGSNGVYNAFQYAIDNNTAPVISISYGECEENWGASNLTNLSSLAQEANSKGITIVAASGDSGAAGCDYSLNPNSPVSTATHGFAVNAPASVPNVTGMGGSEFNEGSGNYWTATTSTDISPSALSYITEIPWNDTFAPANTGNDLLAGGGGPSSCATSTGTSPNATCLAGFPKPSWQTGVGVPNDGVRDVPDVSLNSSSLHDPYLICVQGKCVNGYRDTDQTVNVAGGTSAAAPTFAGIVALINQQMRTPAGQGNINLTLYSMFASTPAAFHDITSGDNKVPCQAGSTDCPSGGQIGYTAAVGYDLASGLGSVDAFNLVTAWKSTATGNLPAPTLTTPTNGAVGSALSPTFSWTAVSGNAGYRIFVAATPADLTTNPTTETCGACTATYTAGANATSFTPSSALAVGTYYWEVQAIEPASSSGSAAWSNIFSFTTSGGTLAAPTLSAPANGASGLTLPPTFSWSSVAGSAGYRILIAIAQSLLPTNPAVGTCGGCALGTTTSASTQTLTATGINGGTTYYWEVQALAPAASGQSGAWSAVSTFSTAAADFSLSVAPTSVTIAPGSSGTSTLTLTPISNFNGSATFTCTASTALAGVTCSVGTLTNNTATVSITASSSATVWPAARPRPRFSGPWSVSVIRLCLGLIALAQLHLGVSRNGLSTMRRIMLGAVITILAGVAGSCGGGGGGNSTNPPPSTAESGTATVTATSGSTSHSVTISVSVT